MARDDRLEQLARSYAVPTALVEELALALRAVDPDRYEDRGCIGRGGMGEVRRVKDRSLERELAMHDETEETRVDPADGYAYTKQDFIDQYGGTAEWDALAPLEVPPEAAAVELAKADSIRPAAVPNQWEQQEAEAKARLEALRQAEVEQRKRMDEQLEIRNEKLKEQVDRRQRVRAKESERERERVPHRG